MYNFDLLFILKIVFLMFIHDSELENAAMPSAYIAPKGSLSNWLQVPQINFKGKFDQMGSKNTQVHLCFNLLVVQS